jgi:O-antigen/teichoic acid export membrane protein
VTRGSYIASEAWRVLRDGQKQGDTAEERSRERYRRVALSAASSGIVRVLFLLAAFITFPLLIRYLGAERFGLWVTLTSVTVLLTFADLGVSDGTLNAVSEALGKENRESAHGYVSTSFFVLSALAFLLGGMFVIAYPHIEWGGLFNVISDEASHEAGPATAAFVGCLIISFPLGLAQKVYMGLQETFVASLWMAVGILSGLAGVVTGVALEAGMPWLVLATAGGPVLGSLLCSVHLFYVRRPWLRPSLRAVTSSATKVVMGSGAMFFVLGIAGAVAYQSDTSVIARMLGASEVSQYAVPMKVFFLAPSILSLVLIPLWPAYRESTVRGDVDWARRTFKRSVALGLFVTVPVAVGLFFFGRPIIQAWAGEAIQPNGALLLAFALWTMLNGVNGPIAMLLNGINAIRFQMLCAVTMAISNIALSILLVRLIGIAGAVYGTVFAQLTFIVLPSLLFIRRFFLTNSQPPTSSNELVEGTREATGTPLPIPSDNTQTGGLIP